MTDIITDKSEMYLATGVILGVDYFGNKGIYPIKHFRNKDLNKLTEEVTVAFNKGTLDDGFGFDKLLGAKINIQVIKSVVIAGNVYSTVPLYEDLLCLGEDFEVPKECLDY